MAEKKQPIFITGIGTEIGKTVVSAIIVEALNAGYWKPVQAGMEAGTDHNRVKQLITNTSSAFYDEVYKLKLPASPHIAAREEHNNINLDVIVQHYQSIPPALLVIEGAGGIMVPLNDNDFIIDLIERLQAKVILVSRNYLGSINHSLVTAALCKQRKLDVAGWIFNDQYLHYEEEIAAWSGYPKIASVPFTAQVNTTFVQQQAALLKESLLKHLS
ncbi:MAG TPA: dethiobiotin synthase [Chitinophagaceae bacterium]|nr:dethiobiotin synthase [Chitinophagaceae bacterium]